MSNSDEVDIAALSSLARISIGESESAELKEKLSGVLSFVEEIKNADTGEEWRQSSDVRNVMREDDGAYESGIYSEDLLNAAPKRKGDHLEVKQVLGHVKKDNNS